jgi:hypothetical protein
MPILLPFAFGGLVLTAVGLGVKRALEEATAPRTPEELQARAARARHQEARAALRTARRRLQERVRGHGGRQERVLVEVVAPFRALLARLERWEQAREADILPPQAREALGHLPENPRPPVRSGAWALLGAGASPPSSLAALLGWLDSGWVEEASPVVVVGVSLFETVEVERFAWGPPAQGAHAFDEATGRLGRVIAFLDGLRAALEALEARVATLHTRATAQLEYLDAQSFEDGGPEPRERLGRLGALVGALALLLRSPLLDARGHPLPPPEGPVPGETPPAP